MSSPFLAACRGESHDVMPVWFMRQAGRALPEYRAIREKHSFEDVMTTPELAAEVTLQPIRYYDVDAAILFSDIMTPLIGLDMGVSIQPGKGPVIEQPIRSREDVARIRELEPSNDIPYVMETIEILVKELDVPLIGFAGAPFTLASYLIEGGASRSYAMTKSLMYADEDLWHDLMSRLANLSAATLRAQVRAGARAVQLFDSWVGNLSPFDYTRYVLPHSKKVFESIEHLNVPRIHFGVGTGELLQLMAAAGADVVGVDWRVPLDAARQRLPDQVGTQGNLDPAAALGPWESVEEQVRAVLRRARTKRHIFNLGHGVLPQTPPDTLKRIVELVHEEGSTGVFDR
ncbi:MAG: uroporphyrinogen decarboxylase [Nitriliruptorales bacterium]|nr:uroporphyrinogen decarboxylase [Nitriliruptorales bacterium]